MVAGEYLCEQGANKEARALNVNEDDTDRWTEDHYENYEHDEDNTPLLLAAPPCGAVSMRGGG